MFLDALAIFLITQRSPYHAVTSIPRPHTIRIHAHDLMFARSGVETIPAGIARILVIERLAQRMPLVVQPTVIHPREVIDGLSLYIVQVIFTAYPMTVIRTQQPVALLNRLQGQGAGRQIVNDRWWRRLNWIALFARNRI